MEVASYSDCLHCAVCIKTKFVLTSLCYNDIHVLFFRNVIFARTLNDFNTDTKIGYI